MLLPAITSGVGEAVLVTDRSMRRMTLVIATSMLLPGVGSPVPLVTVAVLGIVVPVGVAASTLTTIVKVAVSLAATVAFVKVMVPVPPATTESVRDQPAGVVTDTSVVLVGVGSLIVTVCASDGPLLVRPIV